jgi:hypothetical protein
VIVDYFSAGITPDCDQFFIYERFEILEVIVVFCMQSKYERKKSAYQEKEEKHITMIS